MIEKQKRRGITLIALVVTIVVLLILAGTSIAMLVGDNGIITQAKRAKEENEKAQEDEKNKLDELYSSIKVATGDDAEITINMKDLKTFIAEQIGIEGITANSVLMSSSNTSLEVENVNLKSFTNTFKDKFTEYFEYDSTTGELTCLKEGEYIINMELNMCGTSGSSSGMSMNCKINEVNVGKVYGIVSPSSAEAYDNNSIRIYLKKGNKVSFNKNTSTSKLAYRNNAYITIIKM